MTNTKNDERVRELIAAHNNWGRWGDDDELGTLNFITDEVVMRGAQAVRRGKRVSCGRVLSPSHRDDNPRPVLHLMTASGEGAATDGMAASSDYLGLEFHGYAMSHLDAPSHLFWDGQMYNGRPSSVVKTATGAHFGSVDVARRGIVTRGILLDMPRLTGEEWLEPGRGISPEELVQCEQSESVEVRSGDALLVRVGRDARAAKLGTASSFADGIAGLSAECIPWLAKREVAALAGDGANDVVGTGRGDHPMPVHSAGIVGLGLWLLDNLYLDDLAHECAASGHWDFQICITPLRIKNGTGSPVNPIAVL